VTDWERSLESYSKTLGMAGAFVGRDMGWAELDTGEAHLVLECVDPADAEAVAPVGRFVSVSLEVDDMQATYDTLLSRGAKFLGPPEKQP
jgi:hypothetical protein